MAKKRIRKKLAKKMARQLAEQAAVLTEAEGAIAPLQEKWEQEGKEVAEEAEVLVQAQNALDRGEEGRPVHIPKSQEVLFAEVHAIEEAQNAMDEGSIRADHHHLRHLDEAENPDEWNPETVIDEKIKEEQKQNVEQDLKDQIADALEEE